MALDSSLFTLTFQRRSDDATILDLIPFTPLANQAASTSYKPTPLYSYSRARSTEYNVQLIDHLTSLPLSSIMSPSSNDKIRKINLYNPDEFVIFEKKQKLFRQDWRWTWQDQEYSIRRDGHSYIVEAIRQPDPEIDIARYTAATKSRPAFLQILDYNIQRLEVTDRRGLEMLIITATCTLLDLESDEKVKDQPSSAATTTAAALSSTQTEAKELQKIPSEVNEIYIDLYSSNESYVQHALQLMRQDQGGQGIHLIIIKATNPQLTPKAIQIAADVKLKWYRLEAVAKGRTLDPLPGSNTEIAEELYQYVRDPSIVKQDPRSSSSLTLNEPNTTGQRRRIKLDGPSGASSPAGTPSSPPSKNNKSSFLPPPQQLDIYLSKERIDEFEVATPARSSLNINRSPQRLSSPGKTETSTPVIPPKGAKQSGKHENQSSSESTSNNTRKFFGKLGRRDK